MTPRQLNHKGRRRYDALYRQDPITANTWLLLFELADEHGRVTMGPDPAGEISRLLPLRFEDPSAYQLPRKTAAGGGTRKLQRRKRRR